MLAKSKAGNHLSLGSKDVSLIGWDRSDQILFGEEETVSE